MHLFQLQNTKAHVIFMSKQAELHPDINNQDNRKSFLISGGYVDILQSMLYVMCMTVFLLTMEDVMDGPDHGKAIEANGLYHQIKYFYF